MAKLDPLARRLQPVLVDEARCAAKEGDALIAFDLMLVERDAVVDHTLDPGHHRGKVDRYFAEPDPELVREAALCCDFRGPDQGFRGDAPPRNSGAADEPALEQRNMRSPRSCCANARPAAHARADHGDVIRLPAIATADHPNSAHPLSDSRNARPDSHQLAVEALMLKARAAEGSVPFLSAVSVAEPMRYRAHGSTMGWASKGGEP